MITDRLNLLTTTHINTDNLSDIFTAIDQLMQLSRKHSQKEGDVAADSYRRDIEEIAKKIQRAEH